MSIAVTIDLSGFLAGLSGLADAASRLPAADWTPAFRDVGIYLNGRARDCFDGSHAPDGSAWLPLKSPSKRRGGSSAKPLRDTDVLMASMSSAGPGHVHQVAGPTLTWGSNLDRAEWHQWGTGRIPARPFLGITPAMEARIVQILGHHVKRMLGVP